MKTWEYEYIDRDISETEGVQERGDFIIIKHPAVASLFLKKMVHVKTKSGEGGEVKCTPAILKAFMLGKITLFKVDRLTVDHLVCWQFENNEFALHVLHYGMDQNERNVFDKWRGER